MAKGHSIGRVCIVPSCPALRKKGSWLCAGHDAETLKGDYKTKTTVRQHKYGAVSTEVDGIRFDSKAEARRWMELCILQKSGQIRNLVRQPEFALHAAPLTRTDLPTALAPSDVLPFLVGVARMDFEYVNLLGHMVVEDVKGLDNALSKWKRRHVQLEYGITVVLVR